MTRLMIVVALSLFAGSFSVAVGGSELILTDIDGRVHRPWSKPSTRAVVLIFTTTDCPVANSYQPELRRLQGEYEPQGFAFFQVHPDPQPDLDAIREHSQDYEVKSPIVLDRDQTLAKRTGVSVTPEAAVLDRAGRVLYLGRIDNAFADLGKPRAVITQRELRAAIEDIKAGRPVAAPRAKAIGCPIPKP